MHIPAERPRPCCAVLVVVLLCLAGCARNFPPLEDGQQQLLRTELYFGLSMPGGKTVSDAEWQAFLDERITPRFKDGLSVLDASGQFLDKSGNLVRERAKVVIIVHPDSPDKALAIRYIIYEYKQRFEQASVLRVTSRVGVSPRWENR